MDLRRFKGNGATTYHYPIVSTGILGACNVCEEDIFLALHALNYIGCSTIKSRLVRIAFYIQNLYILYQHII